MRNQPLAAISAINAKTEKHSSQILMAGMLAILLGLLFRNSGLYAFVSDEYSYSQLARLLPIPEATVPIYLYLGLYRVTNYCGDGFLNCARLLNVALFVLATPFVYGVARSVAGRPLAVLIALFVASSPINSYTAYFMPESPYFFFFWLLCWLFLQRSKAIGSVLWIVTGGALALLMLVKPHAIFLLPAVLVFVFFKSTQASPDLRGKHWMVAVIQCLIAFAATRLILGFAIAGRDSLTLFGSLYGAIADSAASNLPRVLGIFAAAPQILEGHLLPLTVLYGLPIAGMMLTLFSVRDRSALSTPAFQLSVFSFLVIGSLLLVTALFTASVIGTGPHETASRLHLRYYSFSLPLLLIIAAAEFDRAETRDSKLARIIIATPILVLTAYCVHTRLAPFSPNFIDSPDFIGLIRNSTWFHLISIASISSVLAWIFKSRLGAQCYLFVVAPLSLIALTASTNSDLRTRIQSDPYVDAGIFARQYLSAQDAASNLVVAGPELGHVFRTLLYLDRPRVAMEVLPADAVWPSKTNKRWLLRIGDAPPAEDAFFEIPGPGFTLSRLGDGNLIQFKEGFWPGIVSRSSGLYPAESWGAWSSGSSVVLEFAKPLPSDFSVHLVARAIANSAGKKIRATLGNEAVDFTLGEDFEEKVLAFKNPGKSDRLVFQIPESAPRDGADPRRLSIAFSELRISSP